MADFYLKMEELSVGYQKKPLIHDINIAIEKGEIVVLIGPNGSGKSTILKSITRQLELVAGTVSIDNKEVVRLNYKELAKKMAVVLTERLKPELMTCHDIVATGRYPYTGRLGILSAEDERKVEEAMAAVHAADLANNPFDAISDGQRQRVLLARAICQEPEIIILDEPTSFLDIRHKLELLAILRKMAKEKNITVVMSLHEVDLAQKVADKVICVKGETIAHYGDPADIFAEESIKELYGLENGSYDPLFGSIELPKVEGDPKVLVISACGRGIPIYRHLQKTGTPFAAAILYTNDIDYQLARLLAAKVIAEEPFRELTEEKIIEAEKLAESCEKVYFTNMPLEGSLKGLKRVLDLAAREGKLQRI